MRTIPTPKFPRRLAASLVLATGAAFLAPAAAPASAAAPAAPCLDVTGVPPTGTGLQLYAVTVQTACSAWATTRSTTIERWDGANWTAQQAPDPAGSVNTSLFAVTAMSTASAWVAGAYVPAPGADIQPVIEHGNGTSWAVSPTPALPSGDGGGLTDMSMSSATDTWAVGLLEDSNGQSGNLTEHWDGKAWTQVPAPSPAAGGDQPEGVADISATNAWMVGNPEGTSADGPAWIEHWDGKAWTVTPVTGMPAHSELNAVRALSATNIWAVGDAVSAGSTRIPLVLHYDGSSWTVQSAIPSPGTSSELNGVAVTSTGAMAVGQFTDASGSHSLILLWNGTTWAQLPAASPGTGGDLAGVGGTSNNYWAVGKYVNSGDNPLALHCC